MFLEKKIVLFVVCVLIFGLMSTADAFTIQKMDKKTVRYFVNESEITVSIVSNDLTSEFKMQDDLNRINKIVVKVS